MPETKSETPSRLAGMLAGGLTWALAGTAVTLLAPRLGEGPAALLLAGAAALCARWWPLSSTLLMHSAVTLVFNWNLVPPHGSLRVARIEDAALLIGLWAVGCALAWLVHRERRQRDRARRHAWHSEQQRQLMQALADGEPPLSALQQALRRWSGSADVAVAGAELQDWLGSLCEEEREAARDARATASPLGPGTGRHEGLRRWVLPLRGRTGVAGAALVPVTDGGDPAQGLALATQTALALERERAERDAALAQAQAREQALRSTLLAALAHDHRTPLASILSAASSLREQDERLGSARRQGLAAQICEEAATLQRITENSLQLARLDAGPPALNLDWQSVEELVGSVLGRLRSRDPGQRLKAYVEPGLPLLRADAVLLVQLLDNLIDNALRHGDGQVALRAERGRPEPDADEALRLAVLDRGPGLDLDDRRRVFEPFQRGQQARGRGTGVGLALCRAVAEAHGGRLRWRPREGGGSVFETWLPLTAQPEQSA